MTHSQRKVTTDQYSGHGLSAWYVEVAGDAIHIQIVTKTTTKPRHWWQKPDTRVQRLDYSGTFGPFDQIIETGRPSP